MESRRPGQYLADEFQIILIYIVYSAQVTAPYRPQLAQFMKMRIANKVVALGGSPVTQAHSVPAAATVKEMVQYIEQAESIKL